MRSGAKSKSLEFTEEYKRYRTVVQPFFKAVLLLSSLPPKHTVRTSKNYFASRDLEICISACSQRS